MTDRPLARTRTTRGAHEGDPKTFTEPQVESMVAAAIADHLAKEQASATAAAVMTLQAEFKDLRERMDNLLTTVHLSNNVKQEILAAVTEGRDHTMEILQRHLDEVAPLDLANWGPEEKKALLPMVKDYMNRAIVRVFFTGRWRRGVGILVGVITVLGILIAAATSLYTAFHGAANPIIPSH